MVDVDTQGLGALGAPRTRLSGSSQPGWPWEPGAWLSLADAEKWREQKEGGGRRQREPWVGTPEEMKCGGGTKGRLAPGTSVASTSGRMPRAPQVTLSGWLVPGTTRWGDFHSGYWGTELPCRVCKGSPAAHRAGIGALPLSSLWVLSCSPINCWVRLFVSNYYYEVVFFSLSFYPFLPRLFQNCP